MSLRTVNDFGKSFSGLFPYLSFLPNYTLGAVCRAKEIMCVWMVYPNKNTSHLELQDSECFRAELTESLSV